MSDFGGSHFLGTGTYEADTPEQAAELYAQLPGGSRAEMLELQRTADPHSTDGQMGDPNDDTGLVRQDGRATDHEFQPRWWRNDLCGYPGCGAPQIDHIDGEDARGPYGDEMPGPDDLPNYTLFGQILSRFSKG